MPKGHCRKLAGKVIYIYIYIFEQEDIQKLFDSENRIQYISPSWRDFSKFGDALKGCCFFPNETVQMRSESIKGTLQIGGEEFKGVNSYISRAPGLLTSFTLGYIIG